MTLEILVADRVGMRSSHFYASSLVMRLLLDSSHLGDGFLLLVLHISISEPKALFLSAIVYQTRIDPARHPL